MVRQLLDPMARSYDSGVVSKDWLDESQHEMALWGSDKIRGDAQNAWISGSLNWLAADGNGLSGHDITLP
jgi:hypothetical protein